MDANKQPMILTVNDLDLKGFKYFEEVQPTEMVRSCGICSECCFSDCTGGQ